MSCVARTRRAWVAALALVLIAGVAAWSGCSFDPGGRAAGGDGGPGIDDGGGPDATPVVTCTAGSQTCAGGNLETCNATGDGFDPAKEVRCALGCVDDSTCTQGSNIAVSDQLACDETAPSLTPMPGATVAIVETGGPGPRLIRIECTNCGGPGTDSITIDAKGAISQTGGVDLAWFCLSSLDIPQGVTLGVSGQVDHSVALLVAGTATIDGTVDVSGGDAKKPQPTSAPQAGPGGPGGGAGGRLSGNDGVNGTGGCSGQGGKRAGGGPPNDVGGGGGGGGLLGHGGSGGQGRNGNDDVAGGGNGNNGDQCGNALLSPLAGGGGGGGGADGSCGGDCGWPGGGGGGAIQISARGGLTVSGSVVASGGAGYGDKAGVLGGAGGGGGGGAILLEGPTVTVGGTLLVEGGAGAATVAGVGGTGASAGSLDGSSGANANSGTVSGGGGGGGGSGRVRINSNATLGSCRAVSSPSNSCTTGPLV